MTAEQWIDLATGNGGALVVLIAVVVTAYRYMINHAMPAQEKRWSLMMGSHEEDRNVFREALSTLSGRVDAVHADVTHIKERIQ